MPVMTFLKLPEAVLGLEVRGEQLEARRDDDRPDLDVHDLVRARRSMQSSTGQASTHSPHSEQTPQSRHSPAPYARLRLGHRQLHLAEVRGGGADDLARRGRAEPGGRPSGGRGRPPCRRPGRRRSNPSRVRSWIQRSIMNAARWPAPVARVMSEAPETTSPAANSHGTSRLEGPLVDDDRTVGVHAHLAGERGGVGGHADRGDDHVAVDARTRCPGPASGRRRPDASGAPGAMRAAAQGRASLHGHRQAPRPGPPGRGSRRLPSPCRPPRRGGRASRRGCAGRRP